MHILRRNHWVFSNAIKTKMKSNENEVKPKNWPLANKIGNYKRPWYKSHGRIIGNEAQFFGLQKTMEE